MSKTDYTDLAKRTQGYAMQVKRLFDEAVNELLDIAKAAKSGQMFGFDQTKAMSDRAQKALRKLHAAVTAAIERGIALEWKRADKAADALIASVFGKNALKDKRYSTMLMRNDSAMNSFMKRADNGISLSQRVWNTCESLQKEMELAVTVSIGEGESAATISRRVRQYLNEPDKLFRRVRKGTDADGNPIYGLSKAAKEYHPGRGVYRSAYKNAMRLARTETNMAYRTEDSSRMSKLDFVLGIRINLSKNHPEKDICDELAGDYPKTFKFVGWHPQCRCYMTSILPSPQELKEYNKALLNGEPYHFKGEVKDYPAAFKEWVKDNQEKIETSDSVPYFVSDNGTFTDGKYELNEVDTSITKEYVEQAIANDVQELNLQKVLGTEYNEEEGLAIDFFGKSVVNWNEAEEKTISTDGLYSVQSEVFPTILEKYLNGKSNEPIQIIEVDGKRYIYDGNHRAAAAIINGESTIDALVVKLSKDDFNELYGLSQTDPEKFVDIIGGFEPFVTQKQKDLIQKGANNVLKVAQGWQEVDYGSLQSAIDSGDYDAMKAAAKQVSEQIVAMRKQEQAIKDIIPDVHQWHQQFSMQDLQGAYAAVQSKLQQISSLPLDQQKAALQKEMMYVADPNYLKPHTIHSTWKVAQDAYAAKLAEVEDEIYWNGIKQQYAQKAAFVTKSQPYKDLVQELADAIAKKDGAAANAAIVKIDFKRAELDKKYAAAQAKKAKKNLGESDFQQEAFSDSRRNAAQWCQDAKEADNAYHDNAVEFWRVSSDEEKDAVFNYTRGSSYITEPLRAIPGNYYRYDHRMQQTEQDTRRMTSGIAKMPIAHDIWIKRDTDAWNINYIFGIDLEDYRSNNMLPSLVGMVGLEDSFQSCGSCKATYFGCKRVVLNLYCPAGVFAVYAQPFSGYGTFGRGWDGQTKDPHPSNNNENEIILQRGAKMRITKVEYDGRKYYIDVEVIGFNIRDFDMVSTSDGYYCRFK